MRPLVKAIQAKVYSNAISTQWTYNNHNLGHLGFTTTDTQYESPRPNAAPHLTPVQPSASPIIPPNAPTQAQITKAHRHHKIKTSKWTLYKQTKAVLVQQAVSTANK